MERIDGPGASESRLSTGQGLGVTFESLRAAQASRSLSADELETLAITAHLLAREDVASAGLEAAHEAFLEAGRLLDAVRMVVWLTLSHMDRGDVARASGWLARAGRLLEGADRDCAEWGYLQIPHGLQLLGAGNVDGAGTAFAGVVQCGERFGDADLVTLGRLGSGQVLIQQGYRDAGIALLDEVMLAVAMGDVSILVAGTVYCAVIETCHAAFDVRRAQEWTEALSAWCEEHPDALAFRGRCLTYRSAIMRLHGEWPDALEEVRRAEALLSREPVHPAVGASLYERAELERLRGDFPAAEDAYRQASQWGRHPEPGLSLLRFAQGRLDAAASSIRRALQEAAGTESRMRLLPAYVEIMLTCGDPAAAGLAAEELTEAAERLDVGLLRASAAQADGQVRLASGDVAGALPALRRAWSEWNDLNAPYEAARVRVLIARCCAASGDHDSAEIEEDVARSVFARLGATPDLESLRSGRGTWSPRDDSGLTPREFEVLRLIARGLSNREIALELVISEKTVARHVSNILAKAGVPSRTAAVAYAHERRLV